MSDDLRKKAEELLSRNPEVIPVLSTADVQKLFHELDVHQIELQMQNDELRKAQVELSAARDAYVELYDFAPVGYLTLDPEGRIVEANFTAASLLGMERGQLLAGHSFAGFLHPDALDAWYAHRQILLDHHEKHGADVILKRPDGSVFTARVECTPRLNDRREIDHCLMALVDITERVNAEALVVEAATRWKATFDAMADAVFILDENQRILLANQAAVSIFGCPAEAMQGHHCWEVVHGTERPLAECPVQRMLKTRRRESMELAFDDSFFLVTADPMIGKGGELGGAVHIVRDVTARVQAEEALRASEVQYRTLFEESRDAVVIADAQTGILLEANAKMLELTGRSLDELVGMHHTGLHPPDETERYGAIFQQHVHDGGSPLVELDVITGDGLCIPVELAASIINFDGKQVIQAIIRDISERKKAEEELRKLNSELEQRVEERTTELRESEERFRVLFEEAPDAAYLLEEDGRFVDGNKAAEELFGYGCEELVGQTLFDSGLLPMSVRAMAEERIGRLVQGERLEPMEYGLRRKDGVEVPGEITSRAIQLKGRAVIMSSVRDLTLRKQAEQDLQESEERFHVLFEENPDACFLISLDGRFIDGNKAVESMTGHRCGELVGQSVFESGIFPPAARQTVAKRIGQLGRGESMEPIEYFLKRKDGSDLEVEVTSMIIHLQGGAAILSSARDLTARRQAEKTLRESEERFRTIFDQIPDGILMADPETKKFRMASQAFCTKIGYSEEQVLELGSTGIHPAEDLPYVIDTFEKQARGEVEEVYDIPFLRSDGGIFYADMKAFWILLDGKPYLLGHVRDISVRKRVQDALHESEEKYRMIFESESDAIMIFDAETRQFIDVNNATTELYGYSREEFLQLTQSAITAEPKASDITIRQTLAGKLSSIPNRLHRKKDGTVFPVEIAACTFNWKGRQVVCGVIRDITERVARDEELQQNQQELRKLASELSLAEQRERQRIAAELHDGVSQMLSSIHLRLDALRDTPLPETDVSTLDSVCETLQQTLQQTRSLTFELSCPMLNELGLAAALEELCSSMTHEQAVHFEFKGDPELMRLGIDREIVLYRSARELLINVMKHSGARHASVGLERIGNSVRIIVADDGRGFNASMAGKGFSPSGGFGLFNIREYLQHTGGNLEIESIPGDGTQVVLTVPLEEEHG